VTDRSRDHDVESAGETLHVQIDGEDGRPEILLIHGFLGSSRWFDRLVPLLRSSYRVVRVDLAGHGRSTDNTAQRSPADQARHVGQVVDRLGLEPVATVGHSLGANVAVAMAESGAPTGDLVILGEGPDYSVATPPRLNRVLRAPIIGPLIWDHLPDRAVRQALRQFFAPGFDLGAVFDNPRQAVRDARAVSHRTFERTQAQKEHYAAQQSLHHRVAGLDQRALVVFGDQDDVFKATESLQMFDTIAGIQTRLLKGVGHSSMLEAPDDVADAIVHFLRTTRSPRAR
jgi:pimeloyl-ACP methyl ester carboxylesterase